jgi:hypothetical protein
MASKSASNGVKMTREKETFKLEAIVNLDQSDTKCYAKCSVNYERLTYKVQPIITLSHDWNDDVQETFNELTAEGVAECKVRLAKYREEAGIGTQQDLFAGESASN